MYTKIYIYSLALQAMAEKKTHDKFNQGISNNPASSILDLTNGDHELVQDLIDGAKGVLNRILALSAAGTLKFLPVRIYVRLISACIFLLKVGVSKAGRTSFDTFTDGYICLQALALGVRLDELNASLDLIDQSAWALRLYIVDDLHLAGIFASLLETYTQRFRERFVNIPTISRAEAPMAEVYTEDRQSENSMFLAGMSNSRVVGMMDDGSAPQGAREIEMDQDWFAYPFDPSIAPFGLGITQDIFGFDDGLNFLWNANG